jgi:hypothetical protein
MHINDFLDAYLAVLKDKIYQFDEDTNFPIYIFEKDSVNCLKNKTKDGIHMIIAIQSDCITQILLRKKILPKLAECCSNLHITNPWKDVLDDGISIGHTNWQLFGCRKSNHEPYKLTHVYNITFDTNDEEFCIESIDVDKFDLEEKIQKLSARYDSYYSPFMMKNKFIDEYQKMDGTKKPNSLILSTPSSRLILVDSKEEFT